jgi:YD repeat-containing protein
VYTSAAGLNLLSTVAYPAATSSTVTYLYENPAAPLALTGILDENGARYATWMFDALGRVTRRQYGAGADITTTSYNDTDGSRTVTNALGIADTYKFVTAQGIQKLSEIDRAATATTAAAKETFNYGNAGYLINQTDWNGNMTTYANGPHGLPVTITEAAGSNVVRTRTFTYNGTFLDLPATIVTPDLTTTNSYDGSGNLVKRTLTDTTATTVPYATKGQTRTWGYTWSNFLLASATSPNGNVTTYGYDGSGALTSVTNALGQKTQITSHTGGGQPLALVDPNGVKTTLTYDGRLRPLSSSIVTTAGPLTTSTQYDAAGNVATVTQPDGSSLAFTYDTAHRLTRTTSLVGEENTLTIDALGDVTAASITSGAVARAPLPLPSVIRRPTPPLPRVAWRHNCITMRSGASPPISAGPDKPPATPTTSTATSSPPPILWAMLPNKLSMLSIASRR